MATKKTKSTKATAEKKTATKVEAAPAVKEEKVAAAPVVAVEKAAPAIPMRRGRKKSFGQNKTIGSMPAAKLASFSGSGTEV